VVSSITRGTGFYAYLSVAEIDCFSVKMMGHRTHNHYTY